MSTEENHPDDEFDMPNYSPAHRKNEAKINALLEQIKKNLEDKKSETHIIECFKEELEKFRTKHIRALYQGYEGSGSFDRSYGSSSATLCIKQKQVKELEFLLNQKQDPIYVRFWLEDAETDFFENMKPLLFGDDFLTKVIDLVKTKLSIKEVSEKFPELYLGPDHKLSTSTKFSKDTVIFSENEVIFSENEVIFFKALETAIHEEFLKILDGYKTRPIAMQAMLDGHSAWFSYRASLVNLYKHVGVSPNMIKLRIICLDLARLYFYKRFLAYFVPFKGEGERCLVMAPREYDEMYDCDDIIRKPKGLPLTEPCFPKE